MTTTRRDTITGAVFGIIGIGLFAYASTFPTREGQAAAVSPGFYPRLLGVLLVVLALIQIITAAVHERRERADSDATPEDTLPLWKDKNAFILTLVTLGALIVYPFLMKLVGFAITGFLFLGTLIFVLSPPPRSGRRLVVILGITLGITVLTFVVFRLFLKIPFPSGVVRL